MNKTISPIRFLFGFVFVLAYYSSFSQNIFFQQYTTSDGLPSSTVYNFDQDSNNLLWLGTGTGISAFDGKNFTNYAIEDGLINNVVYGLTIDHLDRKWMATLANKPSFFHESRGHVPAWADSISVSNYLFKSINDELWFSGKNIHSNVKFRPLSKITPDNELIEYPNVIINLGVKGILLDSTLYFSTKSNELYAYQEGKFSLVEGLILPRNLHHCIGYKGGILCDQKQVSAPDQLIYINPITKQVDQLNHLELELKTAQINSIIQGATDQIWLGTNEGLLLLPNLSKEANFQRYLQNVFVNSMYKDREDNIWIGAEGKGMFLLVSKDVSSLRKVQDEENSIIRSFESDKDGNLYTGFTNGSLEIYDTKSKQRYRQKYFEGRLVDILIDGASTWLASSERLLKLDQDLQVIENYKFGYPIKSLGLLNGKLYVFSVNISTIIEDKLQPLDIPFPSRIYSNFTLSDSSMLLGCTEGLYFFTKNRVKKIATSKITSDVRGIGKDHSGRCWIATAGQGVFLLQDTTIIQHFTASSGLSSSTCTHLLIDEQYAWISSNKGINKIDLKDFDIALIDKQEGLSSEEIKYLEKIDRTIYAASSNGIDIFPDTINPLPLIPIISFDHLVINNDTLAKADYYHLSYKQNNLRASFTGISYKSLGNIEYAYRLKNLNEAWISTNENAANWSAIPPGTYQLQVKARAKNSQWSAPISISLEIQPPWWQQWWFRILAGLLICSTLVFIYQRQQLNFKREHATQKRIQQLQLTALRAQMNPHFMFNALSSIQEYINRHDLKAANLYLSRFASLVRSVLNNSTKETISLEEEISQIELYLALENLRFGNEIQLTISIDPKIEVASIFIPTLLLQPFIENAIVHGLFHKQGEKKLHLSFQLLKEKTLACLVEDNGIGRRQSDIINRKKSYKKVSRGIKITEDRLKLINKANYKDIAVSIIDLEKDTGTKVTLLIPFKTINKLSI